MRTRDIDWFALINNQPCHFASNGGDTAVSDAG